MNINDYGFVRVAAATPKLKVADCDYNVYEMKSMIDEAVKNQVQIICFPELCITGYTCADLFFQTALLEKAKASLLEIASFMHDKPTIVAIVGLPIRKLNCLYNVAAVISSEGIVGMIPKTYIPNEGEFYEKRWFASGKDMENTTIVIGNEHIAFGTDILFETPFVTFGIEICEDLWMPIPPSSNLTLQGAELIFNLSASNELVGKHAYRRSLVAQQSGRCICGYIYSSCGVGESSTDLVFSGSQIIAENGSIITESERFLVDNYISINDVDIFALRHDRIKNANFLTLNRSNCQVLECPIAPTSTDKIRRTVNPLPFIPSKGEENERLSEVFNIQTHGLAKRLMHTGIETVTIGISGGLDSTLALLVAIKAFDLLRIPRKNIYGITMPGFGTTNRTYNNAKELVTSLGATLLEIPISEAVELHFKNIGHDIADKNIVYENAQARERTQILMDIANKIDGLVVGTGNMSELALGWATYNGDHMSMYGVNTSVPKTLVKSLVRWIADTQMEDSSQNILHDILDTPFSPELLPADQNGNIAQITENKIGPYELHDFFLHRMLRYGDSPSRIYYLSQFAFAEKYSSETILKWMKTFYRRFFTQQFKRSCMPDGPKVGSINLSPRGDWRMPSDASVAVWMDELSQM
jgi:NH(3)-dependent NAD(+) synthetase (EC 6.3.1.5)